MTEKFVIASSRPWNQQLSLDLETRSGLQFQLISTLKELTFERLSEIGARVIFFPHWSHMIPENVFQNFECIVFHMTDLPFGRGGSPLQNLIVRGIYETKISALRCVAELDAGPVYIKRPLSLHGTAEEIYMRASTIIGDMILEILSEKPKPKDQRGEITAFKRRKPEQSNLINTETLSQAFDMIRMLDADGYPKAFLDVGKLRLEFTRASLKSESLVADVQITIRNQKVEEIK